MSGSLSAGQTGKTQRASPTPGQMVKIRFEFFVSVVQSGDSVLPFAAPDPSVGGSAQRSVLGIESGRGGSKGKKGIERELV